MTDLSIFSDASILSSSSDSFAEKIKLEEFKLLRGEIELRASEQRAMERNVILLCASTYGFLLYPKTSPTSDDGIYLQLAWYLPSLFSFLALVRWRESVKMIEVLAYYIRGIEVQVRNGAGWESFLHKRRALGQQPIASAWYLVFWIVVCVGTLLVAFVRVHPTNAPVLFTAVMILVLGSFAVSGMVIFRPSPGPEPRPQEAGLTAPPIKSPH